MKKQSINTFVWVSIFSVAMGLLESSVVIYLRELYYPEGFAFPLKMMSHTVIITEILREAATLIMLISIGILAGRTRTEKFGYFIYSFAIWDIFYYVFLKLLLNWPESFLTWDILFLLPTTWVGPVIAPVLLSMAMIGLTVSIRYFTNKSGKTTVAILEWWLLITGSLMCIVSFTLEYTQFILKQFSFTQLFMPNESLLNYAIRFVPIKFPWCIFITGFLIIVTGIGLFVFRNKKLFRY